MCGYMVYVQMLVGPQDLELQMLVRYLSRALETNLRSSARAASVLQHQAISPATSFSSENHFNEPMEESSFTPAYKFKLY